MSWSVEQIEFVGFAITGFVKHRDGVGFDGNSLFSLQVHRIQKLVLSLTLADCLGLFEQTVGQSRFTMIDMSDDGEITGEFDGHGDLAGGK